MHCAQVIAVQSSVGPVLLVSSTDVSLSLSLVSALALGPVLELSPMDALLVPPFVVSASVASVAVVLSADSLADDEPWQSLDVHEHASPSAHGSSVSVSFSTGGGSTKHAAMATSDATSDR
jgi:hypothetical protein